MMKVGEEFYQLLERRSKLEKLYKSAEDNAWKARDAYVAKNKKDISLLEWQPFADKVNEAHKAWQNSLSTSFR